jgi:putative tryptophan/tyrosine transport system substrate-binding protein
MIEQSKIQNRKSKIVRRFAQRAGKSGQGDQMILGSKTVLYLSLYVALYAVVFVAEAQQPKKVPRIGFLSGGSRTANPMRDDAFKHGLQALGYVEGKNIVIEWRFAEDNPDRVPGLAAELASLNVEVIVSTGSATTLAAKKVTTTVPIVMAQDPDPVGNGFVASLARPGGNITGLSNLGPELNGKRLELLKEIVPRLSRVAVFGDSDFPGNAQALKETEIAAKKLAVRLQYLDVQNHTDVDTLVRAASTGRADAVLVVGGHMLTSHRTQLAQLVEKNRLPAIYPNLPFVEAGGLLTYGVSPTDSFRRAATYVDKILKGAKPADLPVEQPTKFELIINLKAAKQIGLTIPPNVLARALSNARIELISPSNLRCPNQSSSNRCVVQFNPTGPRALLI